MPSLLCRSYKLALIAERLPHGYFSGAVAETLNNLYGTDTFDFTIDSNVLGLTNPVRSYTSFSQALEEILNARIYSGMHYRNSTRKRAIIGKQVSHFATWHFFRPLKLHGNHAPQPDWERR